MKRLNNIFLLFCLVLTAVSCKDSGEERSHVLKVYNWAGLHRRRCTANFPPGTSKQTGEDIRLIYQVFDINEIMLTKIRARATRISTWYAPRSTSIERMLKKDLLLPIDRNFGKTRTICPTSPLHPPELNKTSSRDAPLPTMPYPTCGAQRHPLQPQLHHPRRSRQLALPLEPRNKGKILMKRQLPRCLRNRHHLRPSPDSLPTAPSPWSN